MSSVARRRLPNGSLPTTPQNALGVPRRDKATATLAGAPPGRATNEPTSSSVVASSAAIRSTRTSPMLRTGFNCASSHSLPGECPNLFATIDQHRSRRERDAIPLDLEDAYEILTDPIGEQSQLEVMNHCCIANLIGSGIGDEIADRS